MRKTLKSSRENLSLTQQFVAEKVNIGLRMYQYIEAGTSYGSGQVRDKLVKLFNVPAETLLGVTDDVKETIKKHGRHSYPIIRTDANNRR